jgi:hypothetical protein
VQQLRETQEETEEDRELATPPSSQGGFGTGSSNNPFRGTQLFVGGNVGFSAIGGTSGIDFSLFGGVELGPSPDSGVAMSFAAALTPNFGIGRVFGAELDVDLGTVIFANSIDALIAKDTIQTDFSVFPLTLRVFTGPSGPMDDLRGFAFGFGGGLGASIIRGDFGAKFTIRDGLEVGQ